MNYETEENFCNVENETVSKVHLCIGTAEGTEMECYRSVVQIAQLQLLNFWQICRIACSNLAMVCRHARFRPFEIPGPKTTQKPAQTQI